LWLPEPPSTQTFVLVNPPYWPGKTIGERAQARGRSNFQFWRHNIPFRQWFVRNLWGIYYSIREPLRTRYIMRHMANYDLEQTIRNHKVVLVRNGHDDWLTPQLDHLQKANPDLQIIHIPGDHDDSIYNPGRYVNLLQSVL
jgi:hypothetical protein